MSKHERTKWIRRLGYRQKPKPMIALKYPKKPLAPILPRLRCDGCGMPEPESGDVGYPYCRNCDRFSFFCKRHNWNEPLVILVLGLFVVALMMLGCWLLVHYGK